MVKTYVLDVSFLNDDKQFADYCRVLPPQSKKRIDKYYFRKDKNLSIGAGIIMDKVLSEYGIVFKNITFEYGENEKPYIKGRRDICFNVSHSHQMAVVSFGENELGVDIEKIGNTDFKIAKKYFDSSEYTHIMSIEDISARKEEFFRMWTLKESFMKATGLGFRLALNSFVISADNKILIKQSVDDKFYNFYEYQLDGYKLSVCATEQIDTNLYKVF